MSAEGFLFVRYGLSRDLFKSTAGKAVAQYLWQRGNMTGFDGDVHSLNVGESTEATLRTGDLYDLLRLAEPVAYGQYADAAERKDKAQAIRDNARGKRF